MLHPDPISRAFPGEIQFALLPACAGTAAAKDGHVVVSPCVPVSAALVEWNAPVHASLAGDDNIEGNTYEVGKMYVDDLLHYFCCC